MKDLLLIILITGIACLVSQVVHKVLEYKKLTKEIRFDYIALDMLKMEFNEYLMLKFRALLFWGLALGIIIYYF
jgi:hypothetical protein